MSIPLEHRKTFSRKGLGMIRKTIFGKGLKKARRNSKQRPLTDEEIQSAFSAGFRVYDKQRGIYVHI